MIVKSSIIPLIKAIFFSGLLFLSFLTFAQPNQNRAQYKLLWKISGKDLIAPSYLFGTMHVYDNKAFDFSDSVILNLLNCEAFAMEVHPDSVLSALVKFKFDNSENNKNIFKEIYNEKDYQELDSIIKSKSGYTLDKLKSPSMAELILEKNDPKNKDNNTFLDAYLYGIAKSHQKQIIGLENASAQLSILDHLSPAEIKKIIISYLKNDTLSNDNSDSYKQLLDIYHSGDIDQIYELMRNSYSFSKEYYDRLITFRNEGMVKNIIGSIHGKSTFVAVGAAHLPGNEGLIKLLEKEGYSVTKVNSPFSGLSAKYQYKSESTSWVKYTFDKGGYSLRMPAAPMPFKMDSAGITLQMSFDLASGAIYQSTYLPMNNGFKGKDAKYILKKFEENFKKKGKYGFEKSKKININGLEGREFWTEDNSDSFRTRLLLRGNILYLLMVGPTRSHASSPGANLFFDSFKQVEFSKNSWQPFSNQKGAFTIDHWGEPSIKTTDYEDPQGSGTYHLNIFSSNNTDESFLIRYNDFPPGRVSFNDSAYYESLIHDLYVDLKGSNLKMKHNIVDGFKGRDFSFMIPSEGIVKGRIVLRGNRAYFLLTTASNKNSNNNAEHFLESLKFTSYDTSYVKEYYLDKANLKINFPSSPLIDEEGKDNNKNFLSNGTIYNSLDEKTGISYIIVHRKLGKYSSFRSSEDFFRQVRNTYIEATDSIIDSTFFLGKKYISREFTTFPLTTNTYKKIKIIHAGKDVYVLLSYLPLDFISNPLVTKIFNSVELTNSTRFNNIFSNNASQIFKDLCSTDSITQKEAREALELYPFDSSHSELIYAALLEKYDDADLEGSIRSDLMDVFQNIEFKDKRVLIKRLLPLLPNTGPLRAKALVALTALKTKDATSELISFLKVTTPEISDIYAQAIFEPYFDSLSLAKLFYPDVLDLLNHESFQSTLFRLTKDMFNSGMLDRSVKRKVDQIINEFILKISYQDLAFSKMDAQYQEKIDRYNNLILLLSSLSFDSEIDKALLLILKSNHPLLLLEASKILINNKQPITNDIFTTIATTPLLRTQLYQFLKSRNMTDRFPIEFYTQKSFAESSLANYLYYDEGTPETIEYVMTRKVFYKGKKEDLYVFKFKYAEDSEWYLGISGPYTKGKKPEYGGELTYSSLKIFDKKTLEKSLKEMLEGSEASLIK